MLPIDPSAYGVPVQQEYPPASDNTVYDIVKIIFAEDIKVDQSHLVGRYKFQLIVLISLHKFEQTNTRNEH